MTAIATIEGEHRSLAAVLHGMLYLLDRIRSGETKADFKVLGAMIYYIDAFPERYHHRKEDEHLFKYLRMRCPDARSLLDHIAAEHETGGERMKALAQAFMRYEQGGEHEFAAFDQAAREYTAFQWNHMRLEEREALPLAKRFLTPEDWQQIDAAFAGRTDPLLGTDATTHYQTLFRRVLNLAPSPIGLGSAG